MILGIDGIIPNHVTQHFKVEVICTFINKHWLKKKNKFSLNFVINVKLK